MRVREAKDFLVQQATEQAALENIPLSELEKRMMYFTEEAGATEDPTALNEEFETQHDSADYEKKISHLLYHAYKRVRKDGGANLQTWNEAIRRLKRGDHYLLVMWGQCPGIHTPELIGMGIGLFALIAFAGLGWVTRRLPPPNSRLMLAIFLAVILACLFFQRPVGKAFGWALDKTLFRLWMNKDKE